MMMNYSDMKVSDLLRQFPDFQILAGAEGLERIVSTVSVMDAPDIYNWMKGGEFLISTCYIMKDNPLELVDLVVKLHEHGAAALGIKIDRFLKELPEEVKAIGNQLKFPLIYLPRQYAFTDIINPVLSGIVNAQTEKLMMSENIHKSFTQMVIQGKDTGDIMDALYEMLACDVALVDLMFNRRYVRGSMKAFKEDIESKNLAYSRNKYCHYPVQIGNTIYGYIIVQKSKEQPLTHLENLSIEHAGTVIKLNIQKEISNRRIEQKYRDEFIQDLILNNIKTAAEIEKRAAIYGWKIENGLVCCIVDIDNFKDKFVDQKDIRNLEEKKEKIFHLIKKRMKNNFTQCFYTIYSDSIVFLLEPEEEYAEDFFKRIKQAAEEVRKDVKQNSDLTISVGVGTYQASATDTYISFVEAQKAVRIGRTVHENDTIHIYADLGVYKILYDLSLEDESAKFCSNCLQVLVDYDSENKSEYMHTLRMIVKNDWNLKKASEVMFIHYNTIKYRFMKMCEIANLDLDNREEKFKVEFCLKLMEMSKQYSLYMKTKI